MKKYLVGPALAALAMFVFGAVYWMSPFPYKVLGRVADDSGAAQTLAGIFPETGTYLLPGAYLDEKTMTELYKSGPSVLVQFVKEGHPVMEPVVFVKGYLHNFVVCLLLAVLLVRAEASFRGYWCRVIFSAMVGLVGAVLLCLGDPIWWHHPWGWHLFGGLYAVLAFAVAGLVLGKFLTPRPAAAPAPAA
jgi:hypothetical protein